MFETLSTFGKFVIDTGIASVLPTLLRSVAGWLENALEDGEISRFEWKQLGSTFFRIFIQSASLMMVGIPPIASVGTDFVITKYLNKE